MKKATIRKFSKKSLVFTLVVSILISICISGTVTSADATFTNIALGKLAEFRNDLGGVVEAAWGNVAGNAIDGNAGTVAQGALNGPYNLIIDLNGNCTIDSVKISWDGTNYATDYDIKVTTNGTTWTTVATVTGNVGGTETVTNFAEVNCQKVMIDALDTVGGGEYGTDGFGYAIWEMQIMGKSLEALSNLALNRPAYMLKDDGTIEPDAWGQVAANAVDGSAGTVAQGADVGVAWNLKVDLASFSRISKIVIQNFWINEVRKFDVKISSDGITWTTILSNAVPAYNTTTIFDLVTPAEGKFVLLDVTEFAPATQGTLGDFAVMGIAISEPETNIALNKPVTMKKDDGSIELDAWGNVAANAVDGNAGTFAQGADVDLPWNLIVNLKATSTAITKVAISNFWAGDIKTCNIKSSNDGVNWTTILTNIAPTFNTRTVFDLPSTLNCKFIMLDTTLFAAGAQGTVAEFEVIGTMIPEVSSNIALNKPAYMVKDNGTTEQFNYENEAFKAVDGSAGTWAEGLDTNTPWNLVVNLKAISTNITDISISNIWVSEITLCDIMASNDGVTWAPVLTDLVPVWNTKTNYTLPTPLNARFIMIDVKSFATGTTGIIAELEVMGTMIADSDSIAPTVTGVTNNTTGGKKTATFTEGIARLNDNSYTSGTEINKTGDYTLIVKDLNDNSTNLNFAVIIYGDVSGDGLIDITDFAAVKNHLLKKTFLVNAYLTAGDIKTLSNVSGAGTVTIIDLLKVKKHLLNIDPIMQIN